MTPSNKSPFPVPVTILTGFLGAGKTTLLNHILHGDHGLKIAVMVNDFGAINIDSQLVVGVQGDMVSLANGCICCTIRTDLLRQALMILERPEGPPEYLIIETSGVSDPLSVAQTFSVPELKALTSIDSILTVVDAEAFQTLEKELAYLAFEQLSVADIIVINKVDLVTPAQLAALKKEWLYPQARIIETTFGQVPLELILGAGKFDPSRYLDKPARDIHVHEVGQESDHEHEKPSPSVPLPEGEGGSGHKDEGKSAEPRFDHSLIFSTWSWTSEKPLSLKALRRVTKGLPPSIFRAKGFLYLADQPDRKGILHMVGTRLRLSIGEAWGDEPPRSQIVMIGKYGGIDGPALTEEFEGCIADNVKNPVERAVNSVFEWLRGGKDGKDKDQG